MFNKMFDKTYKINESKAISETIDGKTTIIPGIEHNGDRAGAFMADPVQNVNEEGWPNIKPSTFPAPFRSA